MSDERIDRWPKAERPRERIIVEGAQGLSDAELLAALLGCSSRGLDVLGTARSLLARVGGLAKLRRHHAEELMRLPGIGPARACALLAAVELGRRIDAGGALRCCSLTRSEEVFDRLRRALRWREQEAFVALALDARNRVIHQAEVALGSATSVEVHPREVFTPLIRSAAAAAIVAHNHPSGDPEPSAQDLSLTERLRSAGALLGIRLLDHLIIGDQRYVSLADRGLL